VVSAKRDLLPVADDEERFRLLNECGDVYREQLGNLPKAIAFYQDALELKPESHAVLHQLLEAFYETKQWQDAVEILARLSELEQDGERRSKYLYTAAVIFRDELDAPGEALEYFNRALDDNPGLLKAFEAIDRLGTSQRDWKGLERNYRKMLKRLPQEGQNELTVMLWHNLGEIYRTRLKDFKSACTAFEVATSMDPKNQQRHEILAELYSLSGPEFAGKAVAEHQVLIKHSPFKFESYKALRRIYMDTRQYDKAWCMCATLAFLKKADAEEQQFFEQYRQKGFVRAQARITDELWHNNIYHQEEDRFVSAILGVIAPVVGGMTARPHKQYRLKRKDRRDLATDQLLFSKVFAYVTSVLGVVQAELYLRPDQQTGLVMAHTTEVPSYVVGSDLLQGRPEKELAFAIAKQLCFLRTEHFLRNVLGAPSQLKTVFLAALKLVDSSFAVAPGDEPAVDKTVRSVAGKLHPSQAEALTGLVRKFAATRAEVNLNRWFTATELSANRAGFILCNDLEVAAKMVSSEPSGIGAMTPKDKVKDLVLYSISEDYFRVRRHLGMTIGQ
jgi:tetratricopeptide (TPR) repeat protein